MLTAKSCILTIDPYKPGKSMVGNTQKVIKLSSNENALGASPDAIKSYQEHASKIFRYADGGCVELRRAIAKKYNINPEYIVCGAGSDEIIALLIQAFVEAGDEVLYSQYGFLMYPISAKRVGAIPVMAQEINLTTNIDNILAKISQKTKMIFIANPNNPTGSYINTNEVERLINLVPKDVIIVLDLAYAEFVNKNNYPDGINLVNKYENVVMTRTFSKIYGLASLRIGWSYSSEYIADILNRTRGPFNVSGPAQSAAISAINDDEFVARSIDHNNKWLKVINNRLNKINIKTYPSSANFILIDFETSKNCDKINEILLENGIILREMKAYGLPSCLRMTIGNEDDNLKFLELLEDYHINLS